MDMARNEPQVNLRMPQELKDQLEAAASEGNRTLTAEIVSRLKGSFGPSHSADLVLVLAQLERSMARAESETVDFKLRLGRLAEPLKRLLAGEELPKAESTALRKEASEALQLGKEGAAELEDKLTNEQIANYRVKALSRRLLAEEPSGEVAKRNDIGGSSA
jgi:Arc-like DNA binding dprotein